MNTAIARRLGSTLVLLCALLLPAAVRAQHFPAEEDLELMLRLLVEDMETVGIVVGALEADGSTRILHYGSAGPDDRSLGPRSVFDIGSITKTFTATILADMVARGDVALEDPVSAYLPEGVTVPTRGEREITLLDLATHTSGLPTAPDNLVTSGTGDPDDPYAEFMIQSLYEFLSDHELRNHPGETYEYSNVGYGLLGHALARAAGVSYRELVRERVLEPLGMDMTGLALEGEVAEWAVRGHRNGDAVPHWTVTEAMEGAGGLRSNAEDLLTYLEANVGPPETDLERAMRAAQKIRVPEGDRGVGHGLAWRTRVSPGGAPIVEHGGASGGFQARLHMMPDTGIGIVVLTNEGSFQDPIGRQLLQIDPPPAEWERVALAPEVLAQYAGEYAPTGGGSQRFSVSLEDEGYLTIHASGQPRKRLYATSDSTFYVLPGPHSFTFRTAEEGVEMRFEWDERLPGQQRAALTTRRVGETTPGLRGDRAGDRTAIEVAPEILQDYVGEYELTPQLSIVVTVEDGALFGQGTGQPRIPLLAESETEFFASAVDAEVTFQRDEEGQVIGLIVHQEGQEMVGRKVRN